MWPFSWIRSWMECERKERLLSAEIDERINGLASPIREGASDSQICSSIRALEDVTQTLKLSAGGTGTVRRKV